MVEKIQSSPVVLSRGFLPVAAHQGVGWQPPTCIKVRLMGSPGCGHTGGEGKEICGKNRDGGQGCLIVDAR